MSAKEMMVIAYDISITRTRSRVFRILTEWKLDGQKSVVECRLSRRESEELLWQLASLLDEQTDRLLCGAIDTRRQILCLGKASVCSDHFIKAG